MNACLFQRKVTLSAIGLSGISLLSAPLTHEGEALGRRWVGGAAGGSYGEFSDVFCFSRTLNVTRHKLVRFSCHVRLTMGGLWA